MLTDLIMEENFEVKEEGPWYDKRDLEHDLHLAAELGKTLLERNHELEEGLQHMYSTNQEQQQEIEYLAKQVELLRQVNEQHAKVYEQLDAAARDLELGNHKLEQDKRSAQKRIHRLTETIDGLQVHLEELQIQVEELQVSPSIPTPALLEQRHLATQSVCCLQELYSSHLNRGTLRDDGLDDSAWLPTEMQRVEEEHAALQRSVSTLQAQLGAEQARRQEAEQEAELMVQEKGLLEQQVLELESSRGLDRVGQLEAELERLRQRWRAEAGGARKADARLVDALLFPLQEGAGLGEEAEAGVGEEGTGLAEEGGAEPEVGSGGRVQKGVLRSSSAEEIRRGHDLSCVRRTQAPKRRGVSLLSEVDAQYSALQLRYEELLRHCQRGGDLHSHKAVQTRDHAQSATPTRPCTGDEPPPEYRALFQEIFSCIQKTREELSQAH